MLCGEGDFSFARAMARAAHGSELRITATSLETEAEIRQTWGGSENIDALELLATKVEVLHGVDATKLTSGPVRDRRFDAVCFMFPHIAGKGRISLNRELLKGFFVEAERVLAPGGVVEVWRCKLDRGLKAPGFKGST